MHYLDKRVQVICDQLKKQCVLKSEPVGDLFCKKGLFHHCEEAHEDEAAFAPFNSQNMFWYGVDEHYWFYFDCDLQPVPEGIVRQLHVSTQYNGWDARNPQFLVFVDGVPVQGMDTNHRDVRLYLEGKHRIDFQAYTGIEHSEFRLNCAWEEVDSEINGLYWDLQVPLQAFARLEEGSQSRIALERVLNDAINLLDMRTPYNRAYLNGGPAMPENMPVVPHSEAYMASVREARAYLKKHLYEELAGHDEVIATCIGHTHIDVAWWWTVAQTREKVARSFSTVLKLMEEYPDYKFMSSQPQLYAFLKERYPELYEQIKHRVEEGRWEPEGGMWVEADCNLTSGESLVRQFIHGKKFFKDEFGVDNEILWLPDVFGYSGALPQIMKECGVKYFMTTKLAWNQFNKHPYDTFMWRGIDGSEILTHLITTLGIGQDPKKNFFTTYNGFLHPDAIIGGWQRYQNKDINNDILISYGYGDGGGGPTREMLETSERMAHGVTGMPKVRQEGSLTYFRELDKRVRGNRRLPTWEGELYFEYHRGTYTSMARNKRSNRKAELHMMDLELLCVLAADHVAYPTSDLDAMWKAILINQFHDILPGSSIHEVYEVAKKEYAELEAKIECMRAERFAALVKKSANVTVYNTKGFAANEPVLLGDVKATALRAADGAVYPVQQTADGAVVFLKDLPAKGYTVLEPVEAETETSFKQEGNVLETPFYTVELDENALISRLYDKENDRDVFKPGEKGNLLRMYEDKPIYYDNWDVDIFYTEKYWDVTDVQSVAWTEMGPVRATLEVIRKISGSTICQKIHFYADSRRIDFETRVDWQEHQHLLKALFPVDVHTDEATFDIQFGNLKRKIHQNTSWDVARFESCAQKWMDMSEAYYGVSLLNDCKYGHSALGGVMGLTLIKSGIEPNPIADRGQHVFTYALLPHAGDWRSAGTIQEAYCLNQPALAVQGGEAGAGFSLCSVNKGNVIVETIKQAEDSDGVIVRMYESHNARTPVTFTWNRPVVSIEECNAIEEKKGDIAVENGQFSFIIKPYEIKTFRIR